MSKIVRYAFFALDIYCGKFAKAKVKSKGKEFIVGFLLLRKYQ